ncbi:MAG: hypothetical protein F7B18_07810 [Desulfurococcales archaeon]|nr:hypothetical protein [Desulfurococcales archaeon]
MTSLHRLVKSRRIRLLAAVILLTGVILIADIGNTRSWAILILHRLTSDGDPILINLYVDIPEADADECGVAVYRYPTKYAPTPDKKMELVWMGRADPGDKVKVTSLVENAPPVKYNIEGELVYREPQEYRITIHCYDVEGNRARVKASGATIVEVRPAKPVVDVEVQVELMEPRPFKAGDDKVGR